MFEDFNVVFYFVTKTLELLKTCVCITVMQGFEVFFCPYRTLYMCSHLLAYIFSVQPEHAVTSIAQCASIEQW